MRTWNCSLIQSPDASEGAPGLSRYSTARTPITALLFEAKRKVALPVIRLGGEGHEEPESGKRENGGLREGAGDGERSLPE